MEADVMSGLTMQLISATPGHVVLLFHWRVLRGLVHTKLWHYLDGYE